MFTQPRSFFRGAFQAAPRQLPGDIENEDFIMRNWILLAALLMGIAGEGRAQTMEPVPVMDLHCDILHRIRSHGIDLGDPPAWPQVTIPTMRAGNVRDQVFAVWFYPDNFEGLDATVEALRIISLFEDQMKRHEGDIAPAATVAEAERIKDSGRIAAWLWLEGAAPINDDLELLRLFHRFGVRGITLTWMNNLSWAGAATDKENPNMGLTDFGREVVAEMNRLGMIVDLSHVSDQTFFDAIETSTDPVVVSHSNCRALADHPRNVTDEMLRALAKNGGVIGICALPSYLDPGWDAAWEETEAGLAEEVEKLKEEFGGNTGDPEYREKRRVLIQRNLPKEAVVTIEDMLDQIEHVIEVAGPETAAVGSDFDGIWAFPVGFEKASKWQDIAEGLRKRGHGEEVIAGVMHGNVQRVFRQVIDE